jgi:anti-sigma regulatory factor (Ser/Thr protein kinase)
MIQHQHEVHLPGEPTSARIARRFVVSAVHEFGLEAHGEVAELLTSELVTNVILHARTDVVLRVRPTNGDGVRVEVVDRSVAPPALRDYGAEAATGRGLALVEAMASAWGSDAGSGGKVVWFELGGRGAGLA